MRCPTSLVLTFLFWTLRARAEDAANDAGDDQQANYENNNYQNYENNNYADGGNYYDQDGDGVYDNMEDDDSAYIEYWTEYAILPKKCIVYNDVDVIIYSVYDKAYNHCGDDPVGTYITPVNRFVQGHLAQQQQDMEDQGYDYQAPDVAQYAYCTEYEIQNQIFYFQLGCADDNQGLAVNIYKDNACTEKSEVDGYDDSNIDVSAIQLKFKKCEACVNWFDMDEQADDQYYEIHQTQAPLCSTVWTYKETCDRKCRQMATEAADEGWNTSDKVLLVILGAFALIMVGLIVRKRTQMSNKETLLEQAAMSAAGLQLPHVIGVCILVCLVVAVFALLGLKNITWALLLIINTALFAYLMKLTVDSSQLSSHETIIGPDGTIERRDSDDSSVEDMSRDSSGRYTTSGITGLFTLPAIT